MPDTLVPPEVVEEVRRCYACDTSYHLAWDPEVQVMDNDGNPVSVHRSCSVRCEVCNGHYVWSGIKGSQRHNVWNKETCDKCWATIQKEHPNEEWVECDDCGTMVRDGWGDDGEYSSYRALFLCRSCYDSYIQCNDCGYEFYENDGHECEDEDDTESSYIHNYSYKPRPRFFGDTKYHFGIELEVEASRNGDYQWGAQMCSDEMGDRGYLKYDGSLSHGFEIVSHPHSLHEMQNEFPWDMLERLRRDGFRSWNTSSCGLHVHVSRTAFNGSTLNQRETHQIKFLKLIYDNQRQVQRLAGRQSTYASFDDKGRLVPKVKMGSQTSGRYSAVNIENDATLEVRVFRGSLRKERVLSAVEFTHAAVEYTRNLKIVANDKPLSWAKFVGYVSDHSKLYPNLFLIMNELFDKEDITSSEEDN
jgi:hypothetical protein